MKQRCKNRGFSLLELLMVLAIMTFLITTGTMVSNSVYQSSILSADVETLANELARASLDSVRTNRPIQMRFYRFADQMDSNMPPGISAYQTLTLDPEIRSYRQLSKIRFLSQGVSLYENTAASTILTLPQKQPFTGQSSGKVSDPPLPTISPYTYYEFEFRPDGSTNLPKDKTWGLVLFFGEQVARDTAPRNYRALGLNPFTGAVKLY